MFGWATETIELPGANDHPLLPVVAGIGGWGAGLRGELDQAERWAALGLDATGDPDDPRGLVALEVRMHVALWRGDLDACLVAADRAASLVTDPSDLVPAYVPALALTYAGRPDDAAHRLDHVLSRARAHGNPTMRALVHYALGEALHGSDSAAARRALRTAIELAEAVDNQRPEAAAVLLGAVRNAPGAPPAYGDDAAALADHDQALVAQLPPTCSTTPSPGGAP